MSTRHNPRRHHYIGRLGLCLAVLVLIVSITGCRAAVQHELTISSSTGGSVIIPGEDTFAFDYGTVVELVAAADDDYYFVRWTGDTGTIADVFAASTIITIEGDYAITAEFGFDPQELIEYDLTISSTTGGSVTTPGEGVFPYDGETVVNLAAEADDCYEFVGWTGDVDTMADAYAAETTITMEDDYSVTANFERIEYSLIISSTNGGSVTDPGEGTFIHDCGQVVDLVAEADAGYRFDRWTGDVDTMADVYAAEATITMEGDYSISAEFVKTYTLTVDSTVGGNATIPGEGVFTYDEGTVVDLTAVADMYYEFAAWTGDTSDIADPLSATTTIGMNDDYSITATFAFKVDPMVVAGGYHTVGLRSNGTLVAAGNNDYGQCAVGDWENIIQVAAGEAHTVGLKNDRTVVAVGDNDYHQGEVSGWTNIVQVATGGFHTVGLKDNGTVVAVGLNNYGQCDVGSWENIIQVAAGALHTVGLKDDGTVVAVGWNLLGQRNVGSWENIIQVAAGALHTVSLKDDGTVVAVGWNAYGQLAVDDWEGIVQVAAGEAHTVGLKDDGTVVAVGDNDHGQCDVDGWNLN